MNKITSYIYTLQKKLSTLGLDDPRLFGLVLLAVIGLSVLWSGISVVQRNYDLQQKVTLLEEENRILELQNRNKILQNEYYKTPEFAELKARRVNGKALPGERVYIIDEDAALASLKTPEETEAEAPESPVEKPQYQQNFEAWIDFFFGS